MITLHDFAQHSTTFEVVIKYVYYSHNLVATTSRCYFKKMRILLVYRRSHPYSPFVMSGGEKPVCSNSSNFLCLLFVISMSIPTRWPHPGCYFKSDIIYRRSHTSYYLVLLHQSLCLCNESGRKASMLELVRVLLSTIITVIMCIHASHTTRWPHRHSYP
jgi:hypothetical protein